MVLQRDTRLVLNVRGEFRVMAPLLNAYPNMVMEKGDGGVRVWSDAGDAYRMLRQLPGGAEIEEIYIRDSRIPVPREELDSLYSQ